MNQSKDFDIKDVALYLRKSRGDEEKDLVNHEIILTDLCTRYNWKYTTYREIGTSDSIEMRPKMQELLKDIEDGLFDAVVVVDDDRLSRGDIEDQGIIKRIFSGSETYIVTPQKIYDLANDEDDFMHDVNSLFSRREYKMINKRFQRGKKIGARRGNWTNGTPPFPYEYERYMDKYNEKGLVINDEKLITYRFIIEQALLDVPPNNIAWELNKQHILSPRGTMWTGTVINRLIQDETHLGKIISNKGKGDAHAKKKRNAKDYQKLPKSEWVIVDNCHEPVKTLSEHNKIIELLNRRKKTPTKARAGTYTFSGLIKCGKCGYGMSFNTKNHTTGEKEYLRPCWKVDSYGNKCDNKGIQMKYINEIVRDEILEFKKQILDRINNNDNNTDEIEALTKQFTSINKTITKYEEAIERVNDAFELGDYTRDEWLERKQKWQDKISTLEEELQILQLKIDNQDTITDDDRLDRISGVLENLDNIKNPTDRNALLRTIIDNIVYNRNSDDEVDIEVNFL